MSSTLEGPFGVPQGSILGPLLFNVFVNDPSQEIKERFVIQYADDTQFIHTGNTENLPEVILRTEQTLGKIKNYFNRNGLLLNSKKTQCIFLGTRALMSRIPDNTTIKVGGALVKPCQNVKNLGLHFNSSNMLFDMHVTEISKKVSGMLMYISRFQDMLSREARLIVVQTLVLSHLNYGMTVWGTTNITQLNRVQKLQKV